VTDARSARMERTEKTSFKSPAVTRPGPGVYEPRDVLSRGPVANVAIKTATVSNSMLHLGVIERSSSPYAIPIIRVKKLMDLRSIVPGCSSNQYNYSTDS